MTRPLDEKVNSPIKLQLPNNRNPCGSNSLDAAEDKRRYSQELYRFHMAMWDTRRADLERRSATHALTALFCPSTLMETEQPWCWQNGGPCMSPGSYINDSARSSTHVSSTSLTGIQSRLPQPPHTA
ncbi:uncharacterized protein EHS24_006133 [Apiotrichum porosum]|uniref:Uncharacterized protein n=1 Tax=Apiotrichum porosum TaxID=105984 RepID=A0A427Y0G7_9TREE|nr:uncharacterized protein EHS24_006133 [Apiotrichum porosum]RSH84609.1 hypothetical protein EHS24_006133 [Apiotrichum porosum]